MAVAVAEDGVGPAEKGDLEESCLGRPSTHYVGDRTSFIGRRM